MNIHIAVLLLAFAMVCSSTVQATPLNELSEAPVSALEFGSFKLEVALSGIKDWPYPIEGVSVFYRLNPDQIEILIGVREVRTGSFRIACAETIARVREFLKVDANGVPTVGRSFLGSYFHGPWHGASREAALRALDANALLRVLVVGGGSCQAALIKAPISFEATSPR